jgi:cob(I)alamin adenosyltransferase
MKIYTKSGDTGETGLFGGKRVPKDELRIEAYGQLDETNSAIGAALALHRFSAELRSSLERVQAELFQLGAELATPVGRALSLTPLTDAEIERLEREIDAMEARLEPLKNFILPGGSPGAALLHIARTRIRSAERIIVTLNRAEPLRAQVLRYVNRLSDHLFVCARETNRDAGVPDAPWIPTR